MKLILFAAAARLAHGADFCVPAACRKLAPGADDGTVLGWLAGAVGAAFGPGFGPPQAGGVRKDGGDEDFVSFLSCRDTSFAAEGESVFGAPPSPRAGERDGEDDARAPRRPSVLLRAAAARGSSARARSFDSETDSSFSSSRSAPTAARRARAESPARAGVDNGESFPQPGDGRPRAGRHGCRALERIDSRQCLCD